MIPMRELEAEFLRVTDPKTFERVPSIDDAQGIAFLCPKCFARNGRSNVGVHSVICWSRSRGTPDDLEPLPGRWTISGTSIDDVHLDGDPVGNARSVLLLGGCAWHGFVNHGFAEGDLA